MFIIRQYKLGDYRKVKSILQEAKLFDSVWDSERNLKEMVDKNLMNIFVAEEKRTIIACVYLIPFGTNTVNLFRLAVKKEYRNKGVGSKLISYAEKYLKRKGVLEMGFFVDAENATLQEFYKKRQFITSGKKYTYMWKELKFK